MDIGIIIEITKTFETGKLMENIVFRKLYRRMNSRNFQINYIPLWYCFLMMTRYINFYSGIFVLFQFLDSIIFFIFIRSESGRIDMKNIEEDRPAPVINYEYELNLIISNGFNHHSKNQIFPKTGTYK